MGKGGAPGGPFPLANCPEIGGKGGAFPLVKAVLGLLGLDLTPKGGGAGGVGGADFCLARALEGEASVGVTFPGVLGGSGGGGGARGTALSPPLRGLSLFPVDEAYIDDPAATHAKPERKQAASRLDKFRQIYHRISQI